MEVNYEQLLQDSNLANAFILEKVKTLTIDKLNFKPSEKHWSILEVIDHLNKVTNLYFPKFDKIIEEARPETLDNSKKRYSTILGRLSIYSMLPKQTKRKYKMKTFSFFEPNSNSKLPNETLDKYFESKERFNEIIRKSRVLDLNRVKVSTALGSSVKFFVPECFEFLLAHEKRHLVQIQEILEKQSNAEYTI